MVRPGIKLVAREGIDPRELMDKYAPAPDSRLASMSNVIKDKSGLGTVAGVVTAATLAYLAAKSRDRRVLSEAVKKGLPVRPNVVTPLLAFSGGVGTTLLGKHFWDKYNNRKNLMWR